MRSKHLLAITVLVPFVTMSSVANAGQTYGRWEKSARLAEQRVPNAYAGPWVAEPYYWIRDSRFCTYQGGPKTNTWTCAWER
jgi:hypothetical protein